MKLHRPMHHWRLKSEPRASKAPGSSQTPSVFLRLSDLLFFGGYLYPVFLHSTEQLERTFEKHYFFIVVPIQALPICSDKLCFVDLFR